MKEKLLIVGIGGHGKVVSDIAIKMNKWNRMACLDNLYHENKVDAPFGLEVLGKSEDVFSYVEDWDVFVAYGDNSRRESLQQELLALGASIPTLIHPDSIVGRNVEIGVGTVVMGGVVINCYTDIGRGCIINTGATVDHDSVIEDYSHISPGANMGGNVKIGKSTWVGIGSTVIHGVSVTANCMIGAGGVVVKDICEAGTYVGVPVRKL